MIIVLYVNDVGERRWDGPFETEDAALTFQGELYYSGRARGSMTANVNEFPQWITKHGGKHESVTRDAATDTVAQADA